MAVRWSVVAVVRRRSGDLPAKPTVVRRRILSKKKFALLLDDIWKPVDITKLGVPLASPRLASKKVIPTPSLDVCGQVEADEEFEEKAGRDILDSHTGIAELAQAMVEECDGLPLALITIGGAMAHKKTLEKWSYAIQLLKKSITKFPGTELTKAPEVDKWEGFNHLRMINCDFFQVMPCVKVLNLSYNDHLTKLLSGISKLSTQTCKYLDTLQIWDCKCLERLDVDLEGELIKIRKSHIFDSPHTVYIESCFEVKEWTWLILASNLKNLQTSYCYPEIFVVGCPNIKKLPLDSNSGKQHHSIIKGEENWWRELQWDDQAITMLFVIVSKPLQQKLNIILMKIQRIMIVRHNLYI
ncbi:hypothetical protein WN944_022249 [Citrus x changshan-huyou]|uniref:NB-ARC domain-containing protein n=1 Tax=Citrus x changshan-huyou TaxID=2935761 RepID=A0AAP0R088_9ROSI